MLAHVFFDFIPASNIPSASNLHHTKLPKMQSSADFLAFHYRFPSAPRLSPSQLYTPSTFTNPETAVFSQISISQFSILTQKNSVGPTWTGNIQSMALTTPIPVPNGPSSTTSGSNQSLVQAPQKILLSFLNACKA